MFTTLTQSVRDFYEYVDEFFGNPQTNYRPLRRLEYDWNPKIVTDMNESEIEFFPFMIGCDHSQKKDVVDWLIRLSQLLAEGTVVFCPSSCPSLPPEVTNKLRVFSNAPQQWEVFPLPYWFDAMMTKGHPSMKYFTRDESVLSRCHMFHFQGYLRSNDIREQMWNRMVDIYEDLSGELSTPSSWVDGMAISHHHPIHDRFTCFTLDGRVQHLDRDPLFFRFMEKLRESRVALCPIGDNKSSRRLYEAAACGALPLLIGDNEMISLPVCLRNWCLIPGSNYSGMDFDRPLTARRGDQEFELAEIPMVVRTIWENMLHWSNLVKYVEMELQHRMKGTSLTLRPASLFLDGEVKCC